MGLNYHLLYAMSFYQTFGGVKLVLFYVFHFKENWQLRFSFPIARISMRVNFEWIYEAKWIKFGRKVKLQLNIIHGSIQVKYSKLQTSC